MIVKVLIAWVIPCLCKIRSVRMTKATIAINPRLIMIPSIHRNRLRFGTLSTDDFCSWGTIFLAFLLKGIHTPLMKLYHEMVDTCRCEHGAELEVVSTVVSDRKGVQGRRSRRCASQRIHAF